MRRARSIKGIKGTFTVSGSKETVNVPFIPFIALAQARPVERSIRLWFGRACLLRAPEPQPDGPPGTCTGATLTLRPHDRAPTIA